MKKLFILFFSLLSIAAYSQTTTFGGIGLRVNDSTTYQTNAAGAHSAGYYDIYFNNQATTKHWDVWNGSSYDHVFDFNAGGGGGGVTTMAAIGSSPNANGATISGSTLNLEPASASFGGVVTTGTQTIAGVKTFSSDVTVPDEAYDATAWNGSLEVPTKNAIRDKLIQTINEMYGTIYNATTFSSLTGFTDNTSGGAAVSGGTINFSGGSNDLSKTLDYDYYTDLEYWKMTGTFTASEKTATSYGFGLGVNTQNGQASDFFVWFDMSTGANSGKILLKYGTGDATLNTSSLAVTWSATDQIILTLQRKENKVTATAQNLTTGANVISVDYTYSTYPNSIALPGLSKFCVMSRGGSFKLSTLKIYSDETKYSDICIVGDSKSSGYDATSQDMRFASLLKNSFSNVTVNSGASDRTDHVQLRLPEIIALAPKNVLLAIGSNDIRQSVAYGTYTVNYTDIVDDLVAAGINVYHLLPFYESGISQTALRDYIIATYPTTYIDTYGLSSEMVNAIHPTDKGHQWIHDQVMNSGFFTTLQLTNKSNRTALNRLSLWNNAGASQLRVGMTIAEDGGFLTSAGAGSLNTSAGSSFDGTNFIARNTTSTIISQSNNLMGFYANSSLTSGNTFTPTQRMLISSTGLVNISGGLQIQGAWSGAVTGSGIELYNYLGTSYFNAFNQTGAVYLPISIGGLNVAIAPNGTAALTTAVGSTTVADAHNFVFNTTTGTKFGTGTTQKIGFYNATPVVQQSGDVVTALSNLGLVTGGTLGTLNTETSTVGNVGTGEDQLFSYTIPAGKLATNGNTISGTMTGTVAANGNTKTLKLKFGSTTILTTLVTSSTITSSWSFDYEITRTSATTQKCAIRLHNPDGLGVSVYATAGETLSGTVALVLTGEATSDNDIVKEMAKVKFSD